MTRINSRLERLESLDRGNGIERIARRGAYYDELTPEQRQQYATYKGVTVEAIETVELAVSGNLHFPLMANEHLKGDTERREHIQQTASEIANNF